MIVALKFAHMAAIVIWAAGLVALPGLYVQRQHVTDDATLYRLQRMVRFAYVRVLSPAAFLAVASGIGLIFLRATFEPWFSLKLALVAVLVFIHTLTGLVIIRLFERDEVYPVWRFLAATGVTVATVAAILVVVLAKPELDGGILPDALSEPGALKRLLGGVSAWVTP